jgi:hypothetical protein
MKLSAYACTQTGRYHAKGHLIFRDAVTGTVPIEDFDPMAAQSTTPFNQF